MSSSAFRQGTQVHFDGKSYTLLRKVTDDIWQLEDCSTKRIYEYTDDQLRSFYANNQLTLINSNAIRYRPNSNQNYLHFEPEQWEQAKVRRSYVMAVLNIPNTINNLAPVIHEIWKKLGKPDATPNPVTVIRWKKKFIKAGMDIISLIERHDLKGNRTARYPQEVTQIVEQSLDTIYFKQEKGTIQDAVDQATLFVNNENELRPSTVQLPLPTRRLATRIISSISAVDRYVARYGYTAATHKFRSVQAHRITSAPLERAEIDHTPLDLMVIDEDTCLPLGRPWVTACIDDYTRCLLGIHISFEPPSYVSVSHCLKDVFCPKVDLKKKYPSIKNNWDSYGVMRELVVDNGLEFHSKSLENACYSFGIEIHYSARKTPWFKGKIERFFGTLNNSISHGTPGTTFSNIFEKGEYDSSKHAIIRMNKLQEIIRKWIVDVYHQKTHRALNASPAAVWQSSIQPEDILLPDDPAQIDAFLGRSEQRCLTHKGIELNYLFYNSPELAALRRQIGDGFDVEIRVDEDNLGYIYVLSPDKIRIFKVPALLLSYANGLSSWQHRVCRKFAVSKFGKDDPLSWLQAKEDIRKLIEEELMNKKQKTRSRIARFKSKPAFDAQTELPTQLSSPRTFQEPIPIKPLIASDIYEDSASQQLRPIKKYTALYRERTSFYIDADQAETNPVPPDD